MTSNVSMWHAPMNVNWHANYAQQVTFPFKKSHSCENIWVRCMERAISAATVGSSSLGESSWTCIYLVSVRTRRNALNTSILSMRSKLVNKGKRWERRILKYRHLHHLKVVLKGMRRKRIKILTKNLKDNLLKTLMKLGSWNCLKWPINASKLMKILRLLDSNQI